MLLLLCQHIVENYCSIRFHHTIHDILEENISKDFIVENIQYLRIVILLFSIYKGKKKLCLICIISAWIHEYTNVLFGGNGWDFDGETTTQGLK